MVEHIAVIGSGTMGRGIAYQAVISGFNVTLQDISSEAVDNAQSYIEGLAAKSREKGYIQQEQYDNVFQKIHYTTDLPEAVKYTDLVIEAVLEKVDLKMEVFKQVNEHSPESAILATNTSTMSPTEIGASTKNPEKFIAMHFFNPVHRMKLIEIIRGLDTSDETVEVIKSVAIQMGKETVEVNEFPGFVTSRMNCVIGNEAMNMLMEGVASPEGIDKAIKLGLNHPMGPLEMADLVGLDTRLRNMEYLHQTLGEKYRPSPLLLKYVKAGRLGKKSGRGFYQYDREETLL
ncbi:3-hydroxyacyl-CoA dehydrogenase [Oceanobacillus halophilus]|uniref:3-hydroxyacyl-CoA dehydrogenase n=1 Tax=Oceanobacillus halophilus TaxID=930130 RepID=A0A495A956_9BACI|nr:3-hydroxyacyl-CoA dehydrogenase [Oceanobacillus halophilus]RKQ35805.1 3-hydroxyacyl-CoA dehydrogenase [Oceanobacillus halophilus]